MKSLIRTFLLLLPVISVPICAQSKSGLPKVPEGFRIKLVASEPLVRNPCSMAFDSQGRLFVGMGPQYRNPKPDTPGDSVVILSDKDGDGTFDSKSVFATGFNCIQAITWRGSDLWIANAPDLTLVRDLDGDDVADEYIRVYTDLGNLEHGLHGLCFGPDGRLYMSKGNSKGLTKPGRIAPKPFRDLWGVKAPAGSPDFPQPQSYKPEDYKLVYHDPRDDWGREGGVLVCDQDGSNLEIVSRGYRNPWDIAFDAEFNFQGTDNDQNEGDRVFMPFAGSHFGWGHSWSAHWTGKDHLPTAPITGPVFHGSGTGMTFYDDKQFPKPFRNVWFFNDWLRKTTYVYTPVWQGALMQPKGGEWREFINGRDTLYKPTDIEVGPDGSLYVLGWGVEYGVKWDKDGKQANEGRIFRVTYGSSDTPLPSADQSRALAQLKKRSIAELIDDFDGPLPIWRTNAQQELLNRGENAKKQLMVQVLSGQLSTAQMTWAIWTLGRFNLQDASIDSFLSRLLDGDGLNPTIQAVRVSGVRAFGRKEGLAAAAVATLFSTEPRARLAAVLAVRRAQDKNAINRLLRLLEKETDRVVFYAGWQTLRQLLSRERQIALLSDKRAGVRRAALLALAEDRALPEKAMANLLGDSDDAIRDIAALWGAKRTGNPILAVRPDPGEFDGQLRVGIRAGLKPAVVRYTTNGMDPNKDSPRWKGDLTLSDTTTIKAAVFVGEYPVGAVATWKYTRIAERESARRSGVFEVRAKSGNQYRIVDRGLRVGQLAYSDRSYAFTKVPESLRSAMIVRTSNEDSGSQGIDFLEIDTVIPVTLFVGYDRRIKRIPDWLQGKKTRFQRTNFQVHTNDSSFQLFQAKFDAGRITLGGNAIDGNGGGRSNYLIIVKPASLPRLAEPTLQESVLTAIATANPDRGRALFYAKGGAGCAKCHRADKSGLGFGPDLSHLTKSKDIRLAIQSILKPGAVIKEGFAMQTLRTEDGKTYSGLLQSETQQSLNLRLADGQTVAIKKNEIEHRRSSKVSPMPAFDRILTPQQVADIVAWLVQQR